MVETHQLTNTTHGQQGFGSTGLRTTRTPKIHRDWHAKLYYVLPENISHIEALAAEVVAAPSTPKEWAEPLVWRPMPGQNDDDDNGTDRANTDPLKEFEKGPVYDILDQRREMFCKA